MGKTTPQPSYEVLFRPRRLSLHNGFYRGRRIDRFKIIFFAALTVFFWIGLLIAGLLLLGRLAEVETFGPLLVHKLLSYLFMIFFAVLTFSNIVTSLSNLYLAEDLYLLVSSPLSLDRVFLARCLGAGLQSGWMVLLFALPIFLAAGIIFDSPMWYYPWIVFIMAVFLLLPAALGSLITTLLVKAFPARKTQDVLIIVSIGLVVVMYFLVRFLRPEQLFNPDLFRGFTEFFATLRAPDSPLIPSVWATEALWSGLTGRLDGHTALMTGYGLAAGFAGLALAAWAADFWYLDAFSKAQEGRHARFTAAASTNRLLRALVASARPVRQLIIVKDVKTFFRDTTQWTQLLLLLALVVVYLFNFKVLPLERYGLNAYHRALIAYVNLVLAGFVLSAVCVRFVLPAVSTEGRAFWILKAAPVRMREVVMAKFWMLLAPIIAVGQALVVISNHFLGTHRFLMYYFSGLMLLISIIVCALAVGLGALMPAFHERNIAKMATGASSIIYMVSAMAIIILLTVLAYWPGREILLIGLTEHGWTRSQWLTVGGCGLAGLAVVALTVVLPLRHGIRSLTRRET